MALIRKLTLAAATLALGVFVGEAHAADCCNLDTGKTRKMSASQCLAQGDNFEPMTPQYQQWQSVCGPHAKQFTTIGTPCCGVKGGAALQGTWQPNGTCKAGGQVIQNPQDGDQCKPTGGGMQQGKPKPAKEDEDAIQKCIGWVGGGGGSGGSGSATTKAPGHVPRPALNCCSAGFGSSYWLRNSCTPTVNAVR